MEKTKPSRIVIAALLVAFSLAGCANWTSIGRTTSTSSNKAIHLDAKQRIVMSKDNGNIFCAEPSPDALSAFAASFGGGLAAADSGSATFAGALSEGAGSIGLRTQTITLLRDSLFRVCEAGYNGQIGPLMVAQLHERFQDVTIGLLAIEQLTGAVVAQQVLLTGRANANAAAAVLDAERYLREAEERERMAAEKLERSQQAVRDHKATVETRQATFGGAPCDGNVPAEGNTDRELCQGQQADLTEANSELGKARDQETKDSEALNRAAENRVLLAQARDVATSSAEAEASNTGQFSGGTTGSNIDEKTVQHISEAVTEIVQTVVNKSHVVDSCLVIISDAAEMEQEYQNFVHTNGDKAPQRLYEALNVTEEKIDSIIEFCLDRITADS